MIKTRAAHAEKGGESQETRQGRDFPKEPHDLREKGQAGKNRFAGEGTHRDAGGKILLQKLPPRRPREKKQGQLRGRKHITTEGELPS